MLSRHLWFRISALLIGSGLFAWLSFEESSTFGVLLISAGICAWALLNFSSRQFERGRLTNIRSALIGLISGLVISPLAIFLMAFKSGLHGHGTPDFTPTQIEQVFSWFPLFGLGGILSGLMCRIWLRASRSNP